MATSRKWQGRNCSLVVVVFILAAVRSEENLAILKTTTQSSNYYSNRYPASSAVDGCKNTVLEVGCCSHTAVSGPNTVWWRVDLGQISTIDSIQIIYREHWQIRFAGYHLYVSNTTISPQDGVLCYLDTSITKDDVQLNVIHQCPYVGRYVTVYNYRTSPKQYNWYDDSAILELCEVLVYGCPAGMFGNDNCNQVCSESCYGGNCNPKTGICLCKYI
ncbi:fucolectin-like [Argopecten irradians]|uniref:fucolectin-like n=1 Tax=Argopecten irradians TaxID=31199 RepID=UPI00371ECD72